MIKKYLLIVEGECTEKNIFQNILEKYGFDVIREGVIDSYNVPDTFKTELQSNNNLVVIIQGPRTRIHDFLSWYNKNEESLELYFSFEINYFQGIFLLYDVDHNTQDDIENMFLKFNDESSGLLLLSSPCIEVLAEKDFDIRRFEHLKEYKSLLNDRYNHSGYKNAEEYIINNFESLCLHFLDLNLKDFGERNVMEHPKLIIDKIAMNERVNYPKDSINKSYVIYRYYTTVVYVFIAFINGLTTRIDNYEDVKNYFVKFEENN